MVFLFSLPLLLPWDLPMGASILFSCVHQLVVTRRPTFINASLPPHYMACALRERCGSNPAEVCRGNWRQGGSLGDPPPQFPRNRGPSLGISRGHRQPELRRWADWRSTNEGRNGRSKHREETQRLETKFPFAQAWGHSQLLPICFKPHWHPMLVRKCLGKVPPRFLEIPLRDSSPRLPSLFPSLFLFPSSLTPSPFSLCSSNFLASVGNVAPSYAPIFWNKDASFAGPRRSGRCQNASAHCSHPRAPPASSPETCPKEKVQWHRKPLLPSKLPKLLLISL